MKIIITEEQLFTVKSLNGVKKYIEDYLSQFEHFVKLEVRVSKTSTAYFNAVENPTLVYFYRLIYLVKSKSMTLVMVGIKPLNRR